MTSDDGLDPHQDEEMHLAWQELAYQAEALDINPMAFYAGGARSKTIDELQDEINERMPDGYVFSPLDAHLMRCHGWTEEMVTQRTADPSYKPTWHDNAHKMGGGHRG